MLPKGSPWTLTSVYVIAGAEVMSVPLGGGSPTTLAVDQGNPLGLALDATHVYWTSLSGAVLKVPIAGGAPTTLARASMPTAIAVHGASAYWIDNDGIVSVSIAGGMPVTLAAARADPFNLAVGAGTVYFTTMGASAIVSVPTTGGPTVTLASGLN